MLARTLLLGIAAVNGNPHTVSHEWDARERELHVPSPSTLVEIDDGDDLGAQIHLVPNTGDFGAENTRPVAATTTGVTERPSAGIKTTVRLDPGPGDPTSYWTYPSWWGHREHIPSQKPFKNARRPLKTITNAATNTSADKPPSVATLTIKPQTALPQRAPGHTMHQGATDLLSDPSIDNWSFPKRMVDEGTQTLTGAFVRPPSRICKPTGWSCESMWLPRQGTLPVGKDTHADTNNDMELDDEDTPTSGEMHLYNTNRITPNRPHNRVPVRMPSMQSKATATPQTQHVYASPLHKPPKSKPMTPDMSNSVKHNIGPQKGAVPPPVSFTITRPRLTLNKPSIIGRRSDPTGLKSAGHENGVASTKNVRVNHTRGDDLDEVEEASAIEIALRFMGSDFPKCLDMGALAEEDDELADADYHADTPSADTSRGFGIEPHL
ncbi:hypothetical protein SeLEV6574_g07814 [Synchytrium endobioticum]|nr:hypothetical protein SeLEV6574_g07814 [Synchytrium endobioticum]